MLSSQIFMIPVKPKGFTGIIMLRILLLPVVFVGWNYFIPFFLIFLSTFIFDLFSQYSLKQKIFLAFLYSLIFNFGILSWLLSVDLGVYALIYNTTVYFLLYLLLFIISKTGKNFVLVILIYLLFEFLSNLTNFLFPWCNLGNALCQYPLMIQWYSITGAIGGSLWLLMISFFIVTLIRKSGKNLIAPFILLFFLPLALSAALYFNGLKENYVLKKVITFNPTKFMTAENLKRTVSNSNENLCYYVQNALKEERGDYLLVMPEITLRGVYFPQFNKSLSATYLRKLTEKDKCSGIFMGATCYTDYEVFNSAIVVDSNFSYIKVKNKLIPYVETLPLTLNKYLRRPLYSTSMQDSTKVINKIFKVSPFICYDAFYPYYYSKSSQNANSGIVISSEDFLNNNSIGISQYTNLLRLRCIETGKPLVKNSYNGNSLIINKFGLIESIGKNTEWNTFVIEYEQNPKNTLFTKIVTYLNL